MIDYKGQNRNNKWQEKSFIAIVDFVIFGREHDQK